MNKFEIGDVVQVTDGCDYNGTVGTITKEFNNGAVYKIKTLVYKNRKHSSYQSELIFYVERFTKMADTYNIDKTVIKLLYDI